MFIREAHNPLIPVIMDGSEKMDKNKQIKELSIQLKNVGPKLAEKLIDAGIDSPEKLKDIGAKAAFQNMYAAGDAYGDFNAAYLYALEGAIQDLDWLDISEETKQEFKKFAQDLQIRKKQKG